MSRMSIKRVEVEVVVQVVERVELVERKDVFDIRRGNPLHGRQRRQEFLI